MRPLSLLLFLALNATLVSGASVNIACGRTDSFIDDDGAEWIGDGDYINIGTAGKVAGNASLPEPLTHLRYFPGLMTACYNLTDIAIAGGIVTLTTTFYYGNYDGAGRPPEFRVRYDNHTWKSVVTSSATETYPLTFVAETGDISVCLGIPAGDYNNTAFVNTIQIEGSVRTISKEGSLKPILLEPRDILMCLVVLLVILAVISMCCCCCLLLVKQGPLINCLCSLHRFKILTESRRNSLYTRISNSSGKNGNCSYFYITGNTLI